MYPCVRRNDINSIGYWTFSTGRPTEKSVQKWVQRCNFSLKVVARLLLTHGSLPSGGWLVKIFMQDDTTKLISVSSEVAASHAKLRRCLMTSIEGAVCRMTADDFLSFVECDRSSNMVYVSRHIGKALIENTEVWVFPTMTYQPDSSVRKIDVYFDERVVRSRDEKSISIPEIPRPFPMDACDESHLQLQRLGKSILAVYGEKRLVRVLHLCSSALKAIHFDNILRTYHFVPVTNISGPANCGKTLASAIALHLMESPTLMMSRATPSAMIDAADTFQNMLIVWDDPRDCNSSQMSSIVHEAFNALPTSLVTRGMRRYNSTLIIGTQERNLGMPYNAVNVATFSRLSHVDMELEEDVAFASEHEAELQAIMQNLSGMLHFLIEATPFEADRIAKIYDALAKDKPHIMGRSLQIAAIDYYYTMILSKMMKLRIDKKIDTYFERDYMNFLTIHCNRHDPVERFCNDLKCLLKDNDPPFACFKNKLTVDLKQHGPSECVAVYTKEFLPYMQRKLGRKLSYSKEQLHNLLKPPNKYGETSKNVAYKLDAGVIIRRSVVLRSSFLR